MVPDRRLEFHALLEGILGSEQVYFQPPTGQSMEYPCIVYERDNADVKRADNIGYHFQQRYQVTYIARDPDSELIESLSVLPLSSFNRHFATSGLNHDVFSIYY
jgi:hypothetical protein